MKKFYCIKPCVIKMEILNNLKKKDRELGLYDNNSKNQSSVVADKVIDVTDICPKSAQCLIKYANVTRGRIAQINDRYKKDDDLGCHLHYHINEMTIEQLANDEVFARRARVVGADNNELAKVIFENQ